MNIAIIDDPRRLRFALLGRVQDAEAEHDCARRAHFVDVTATALDTEKALWTELGASIAALAGQVRDGCMASLYVEARPRIGDIVARLSEAIDDQFDAHAWRLVDAAARLAAHDR